MKIKISLKRPCPECGKVNYHWFFYPPAIAWLIAALAFLALMLCWLNFPK
jgi:hypothetical protein